MRETIDLDGTPCNESCAQVGEPDYYVRAKAECRQFIRAIKRTLGEPPPGVSLRVRSNAHDFGTYHTVGVSFDDNDEAAAEYAYRVEAEAPSEWTDEDRAALTATLTEHAEA